MFDSPSGLTKAAPYIFTIDHPATHANPVIKIPADNLIIVSAYMIATRMCSQYNTIQYNNLIIEIIFCAITDESQMFNNADIMIMFSYVIIVLI